MVTILRAFLITALLLVFTTGVRTLAVEATNQYPFAAGTIQKVDAQTKLVSILTTNGPQLFLMTDRTYIFRDKEKLSFDKLKVGDIVRLSYSTNETGKTIVRLKIKSPEQHPAP